MLKEEERAVQHFLNRHEGQGTTNTVKKVENLAASESICKV